MKPRLLIDAGNSRLKWALADGGDWQAHGDLAYEELSRLGEVLPLAGCGVVASVTSPRHESVVRALLHEARLPTQWVRAGRSFDGLTNTYDEPAQLGVDRWMAMIGARARARAPRALLVVSVGTAMTVDAVSEGGAFLGGLIVPGAALMAQSLEQGTARVGNAPGAWEAFPIRTADAVHSGIIAALAGAVLMQYERLAATANAAPCCFLTGGGAPLLQPHLPFATEQVPNLVLEGIERVSREGSCA